MCGSGQCVTGNVCTWGSIGWALFGVNFRPLPEIEAIMGGGRIFDTGPFFVRLRYFVSLKNELFMGPTCTHNTHTQWLISQSVIKLVVPWGRVWYICVCVHKTINTRTDTDPVQQLSTSSHCFLFLYRLLLFSSCIRRCSTRKNGGRG